MGGIKYVIKDGENGFLVEPGRADELAGRIKEIISKMESPEIKKLTDNARADAMEYSFSSRAGSFLEKA